MQYSTNEGGARRPEGHGRNGVVIVKENWMRGRQCRISTKAQHNAEGEKSLGQSWLVAFGSFVSITIIRFPLSQPTKSTKLAVRGTLFIWNC